MFLLHDRLKYQQMAKWNKQIVAAGQKTFNDLEGESTVGKGGE